MNEEVCEKIFKIECKTQKGSDWLAENEVLKEELLLAAVLDQAPPPPVPSDTEPVRSIQITGT